MGDGQRQGGHGRIGFDEVVFGDTETTGLAPYGLRDGVPTGDPHGPDRLCSAAFVVLRREGRRWVRGASTALVADPGRPVPEEAARVNGFHRSMDGSPAPEGRAELRHAPTFAQQAAWLTAFLAGRPLVFHNANFDAAVLDAELERAGLPPLDVPVFCTKKAFADMRGLGRPDTYLPGTNLNALCDMLGVDRSGRIGPDGKERHGAAVDAEMGARCFALLEPAGWMLPEDAASLPHRRDAAPARAPGR